LKLKLKIKQERGERCRTWGAEPP